MSTMRQPRHRRPSWMRDAKTYRIHAESKVDREPEEAVDPDVETYCYDPEYTDSWELKDTLRSKLPVEFQRHVEDWSCAAAAIKTSIARLHQLDCDGLDRPYPKRTAAHLSRTPSDLTSLCSPSPPYSASPAVADSDLGNIRLPAAYAGTSPPQSAMPESPPWTPDDVQASLSGADAIDPLKLDERLGRVQTPPDSSAGEGPQSATAAAAPVLPCFDQISWDRYVDEYACELDGLHKNDLPRFRHLAHRINCEYGALLDGNEHHLDEETKAMWQEWWAEKVVEQQELEKVGESKTMPTVDEIKHVRMVYGMHV